MVFRLVPNSVTLNDLERRNSPNLCVISPNSVAFCAHYVKVVEDTPILSVAEIAQRISFLAIHHLRTNVLSCCDAWLPVYSKHCDRPMSVAEFMRESIVLRSTCTMSS